MSKSDQKYSRVAVLMGGWSSEREVSLVSGKACASALGEAGYDVVEIDVGRDVSEQIKAARPDLVFNALHGPWGEDGCVQGLLEVMGIPYTHSGVLASSIAMDKEKAKYIFRAVGLPCADSIVIPRGDCLTQTDIAAPYVVKPVNEGSSVGVYLVRPGDNLPPPDFDAENEAATDLVMVEQFVPGRELTVSVMGDRALAVTEIHQDATFYDYHSKYSPGGSRHTVPAELPRSVSQAALDMSLVAHDALGCRGVSRADFRYDDTGEGDGRLVLLEVNTQPGMTPTSLVPEQAAHVGISFPELVQWITEDASCSR